MQDRIIVRTRYGKEKHWGGSGSSTTWCGVWLKANGSHFRVSGATVPTCEKCAIYHFERLGDEPAAPAADEPADNSGSWDGFEVGSDADPGM
jgi:hypothetical protein